MTTTTLRRCALEKSVSVSMETDCGRAQAPSHPLKAALRLGSWIGASCSVWYVDSSAGRVNEKVLKHQTTETRVSERPEENGPRNTEDDSGDAANRHRTDDERGDERGAGHHSAGGVAIHSAGDDEQSADDHQRSAEADAQSVCRGTVCGATQPVPTARAARAGTRDATARAAMSERAQTRGRYGPRERARRS